MLTFDIVSTQLFDTTNMTLSVMFVFDMCLIAHIFVRNLGLLSFLSVHFLFLAFFLFLPAYFPTKTSTKVESYLIDAPNSVSRAALTASNAS